MTKEYGWSKTVLIHHTENDATVTTDAQGRLLGAHIAADGQCRFTMCAAVSHKFEQAILRFWKQTPMRVRSPW